MGEFTAAGDMGWMDAPFAALSACAWSHTAVADAKPQRRLKQHAAVRPHHIHVAGRHLLRRPRRFEVASKNTAIKQLGVRACEAGGAVGGFHASGALDEWSVSKVTSGPSRGGAAISEPFAPELATSGVSGVLGFCSGKACRFVGGPRHCSGLRLCLHFAA